MKNPRNSIKKIYDCIVQHKLENVIQSCYLLLSCNDENKAHIGEDIRGQILSEYENEEGVENLLDEIVRLKSEEYDYLNKEDFNIILALKYRIKKGKG